jgi:hypothetical protein
VLLGKSSKGSVYQRGQALDQRRWIRVMLSRVVSMSVWLNVVVRVPCFVVVRVPCFEQRQRATKCSGVHVNCYLCVTRRTGCSEASQEGPAARLHQLLAVGRAGRGAPPAPILPLQVAHRQAQQRWVAALCSQGEWKRHMGR